MSGEYDVQEAQMLSESMQHMYVNTPMAKSNMSNGTFLNSALLSPPRTLDARQKRERSESLNLMYYTNDALTTKRRLRSRSRLALDGEDVISSAMLTPCTTKPKDRHISKQTEQEKELFRASSSVFLTPGETPCDGTRKPLQSRDLNSTGSSLVCKETQGDYDYSSDSSSDNEIKAKLLTFDEQDEYETPHKTYDDSKIIGKRMGERRIDFVKELVDLNCEEICKQIFCYLEPHNLQRVASVSKLWRRICKKDRIASPRLDHYIHGRKQHVLQKGKENLGHYTKSDQKLPHRSPFAVKNNTIWTPETSKSNEDKEVLDRIKSNIMSVYEKMKCPVCGSPSRKLSNETCQCEECHETFCQSCQRRIDERHKAAGKCAIKVSRNPKKSKDKQSIGSKQSKSRLKRF